MIGEGKFRADLSRGFALLKKLAIAVYMNPRPTADQATTDLLRSAEGYVETYNRYFTYQAYDILLDDGAFFFFRRNLQDETLLSYGYFESPYIAMSFGQFVCEFYGSNPQAGIDVWQEYEEYRSQLPLRSHIVPLRYDWSPSLYREGAHPAAHLHLGYDTELRLAVDAILTPLQFVLLVIRHFYLKAWEKTASHLADVTHEAGSISDTGIVPEYRKGRDLLELRLVATAAYEGVVANGRPIRTDQPRQRSRPKR